MSRLVLLRHGESEWNKLNLFTGWYDCDLTEAGQEEAFAAGGMLAEHHLAPDVLHTSLQVRAIRTANSALDVLGRLWIPVRRSWRLNERHYGDLTGKNKAEITDGNEFNPNSDVRYEHLPPELVPRSECLKDVVERMLPYWYDAIVPDLAGDATVLVVAHGNSLRALVKHLDGISDDEITELNIPTGVPLLYELGDDARPVESKPVTERYLMDAAAVTARAEAVARQAKGG